jgi:hypothetical protein
VEIFNRGIWMLSKIEKNIGKYSIQNDGEIDRDVKNRMNVG